MTQTITRMFGSYDQAMGAVAELKRLWFHDDEIFVVAPPAVTGSNQPPEALVAEIVKGAILKAHAQVYAEGVRQGGTLVTVHAPFGAAERALAVLDQYRPVHSGIPHAEREYRLWDESAPLSSLFHWPIRLDDPTPFATLWGVPTLTKRWKSVSRSLGIPELTDSALPRTKSFGLPLLSHAATPLSSLFKLPVLLAK